MYDSDRYIKDSFKSANNPLLAEKDYLECLILDKLFTDPYFKDSFVFAGGGTITKIYKMGNRIGQDIDLALVDFNDDPKNSSQLHRFRTRFTKFVFNDLNTRVSATLKQIGDFKIITDHEYRAQQDIHFGAASPTLHILYQSEFNQNGDINIEFIPRHYDTDTIQHKAVTPYSTGETMTSDVPSVHYAQTFWDKIYALHTIHEIGVMRPGLSNHYYDVANLSKSVNLGETQNMLLSVAEYQQTFTTRKMTPLTSVHDVKLLPSAPDMKRLSIDYQHLRGRFINNMEPWPRVLMTINRLNKNIKTLGENSK